MCEKCEKLLSDPKFLFDKKDLKEFVNLVNACLPILLDAQKTIIRVTAETGKPMHPVTLGAVLGWLYYASVMNGVEDGDISEEQFQKFDAVLRDDCRKGVKQSIETAKRMGKMEVKVIPFEDLPDDIKAMVKETLTGTLH